MEAEVLWAFRDGVPVGRGGPGHPTEYWGRGQAGTRRRPYSTRLGIRLPEPGEPNTTPRTRARRLLPLSSLCPPARVASGSGDVECAPPLL